MGDERRQFFRVRYPAIERPIIEIDGSQHEVAELSEGGLRVLGTFTELKAAQQVAAELRLLSGAGLKIAATFARIDGEEAIFENLQGVAFAEMMNEQRYLIRKYPSTKEEVGE